MDYNVEKGCDLMEKQNIRLAQQADLDEMCRQAEAFFAPDGALSRSASLGALKSIALKHGCEAEVASAHADKRIEQPDCCRNKHDCPRGRTARLGNIERNDDRKKHHHHLTRPAVDHKRINAL